jgi:hypothetical protein
VISCSFSNNIRLLCAFSVDRIIYYNIINAMFEILEMRGGYFAPFWGLLRYLQGYQRKRVVGYRGRVSYVLEVNIKGSETKSTGASTKLAVETS